MSEPEKAPGDGPHAKRAAEAKHITFAEATKLPSGENFTASDRSVGAEVAEAVDILEGAGGYQSLIPRKGFLL
jgi:hypothetical protein